MILPVDALFRAEREAHGLHMHCEDCVLFDGDQPARQRCAHGYPTEPHRRPASFEAQTAIQFCKDFEAA